METPRVQRKLAAILSADVKDYSRLMEQDEIGTVAAIKAHRALFSKCVLEHGGRVVDSPGDNILAEFPSVVNAVECALKIQKELQERNQPLPEDRRMEFRLGINLGDVIEDGGRIYGEGVNIAARVQSLAPAGGICLSGSAYDQIENKLLLTCDYLGEYHVKNISKPIRVYAIREISSKISRRPAKSQKHYWKTVIAALAGILLAAGIGIKITRNPLSSSRDHPTIAVLPFLDMSPAKDQDYFTDGLTEELMNTLCRIPELRVVGRTSCFQFKGKNEDIRAIGRKLNASAILEGSVRKEGGSVRITAQLINAQNGFHIWSETYDRKTDDIFLMQDQIATAVTRALQLTLVGEKIPSQQTQNSEAYHAYLLGKYYGGLRTKEDLERAIEYFHQAINLDSNYALAWTALSLTRQNQTDWGYYPVEAGYREARKAVLQALAINPDLAMAHAGLGGIKLSYEWDWPGADSAYRRALELEPNNSRILANTADLLMTLGLSQECISLVRRAVELDPLNLGILHRLGIYAYYAGFLDEAVKVLEKTLEINPKALSCHEILGEILLQKKQPQEALIEMQQESSTLWRLEGLALTYHALGQEAESDSALAQLISEYQSEAAYEIAGIYAYRGETDQAFTWLERAYEQRDSGLTLMKVDPGISNLRGDPRYAAFLKKMKLNN